MTMQPQTPNLMPASGAHMARGAVSFFQKAEMTSKYLKAGFMGFAGDGKTFTACLLAIGLELYRRKLGLAPRPVLFLDTENGSDYVAPLFKKAGVELLVKKTKAFDDLCTAVTVAERDDCVLLIDSVSHFWKELVQSYLAKQSRTSLVMTDWNWLKEAWSTRFTDNFVNSKGHVILCGRAAFEYDHFEDDSGKKQVEKTGIKMRAEGELGYEPNLVVQMEREMEMKAKRGAPKKVIRVAHILKDRADLIDEKKFRNPTFADFLPHIEYLNLIGPKPDGIDTSRNSRASMPAGHGDKRQTQRKIVLGEIEDLLVEHIPGQGAADKARKVKLLKKHFKGLDGTGACWVEIETVMALEPLRAGYDTLHRELTVSDEAPEGMPSRYAPKPKTVVSDEVLPTFDKLPSTFEPNETPNDFVQLSTEARPLSTITVDHEGFVQKIEEAA